MNLILASSSVYRQNLLKKLCIPFSAVKPNIDETPEQDESANCLVRRLAKQKAEAVAVDHDNAWIIASDQVACFEQQILGKPHNAENARQQLSQFSGKSVKFLTSLCIYHAESERVTVEVEEFEVKFRLLSENIIDKYIELEQPFDCAGSFKSEGLGILLFDQLKGRDPNALVGLPLILLRELFQRFDIELFDYSK